MTSGGLSAIIHLLVRYRPGYETGEKEMNKFRKEINEIEEQLRSPWLSAVPTKEESDERHVLNERRIELLQLVK